MKLQTLLALPPTILLLCASPIAAEPQWPHNLPRHMKYFPEEEAHVKRGLSIQERLRRGEKPIGVKKMSSDEGEMFFLDNWLFESNLPPKKRNLDVDISELGNVTNGFASPLRPHGEGALEESLLRWRVRSVLLGRGFKCPDGTSDCSSIGAPNSCCGTGSNCISIEDTGYGSVGCCPNGQTCAGSISCDTKNGYTDCPDSPNGGCCLPGYACQDVGCVIAGTSVTFVQPSTSAAPSSPSSTAVIVVPTTPSPTPTPTPSTSYTCSTGWFTCPASLGGGCCQSGLTCATGASCLGASESPSSTVEPSAPVRPTSNSAAPSAQPSSSFPGESICPIGFYVCSAYYPSGCCRVGRDCKTTGSCDYTPTATIVNTNGVTVVAPSGAGVATTAAGQGGSCPSDWYSCAASRGGNCCPNGYSCAEQCTATVGTGVSLKVAPSMATIPSIALIWAWIVVGITTGVAMVWL